MAAKFRKVDPRVWDDEKFQSLTTADKLVAIYCFTSSQCNRIGLFRFSIGRASEDLGVSVLEVQERLDTVCHTLSWRYDKDRRVLYLPTWWKYNTPDNHKAFLGALTDLHELPQTPLLSQFASNGKYLPDTLSDTLSDTVCHTVSPQEKEKEQEKEQEKETEQEAAAADPRESDFSTLWNAAPEVVQVRKLSKSRLTHLRARLKSAGWWEDFKAALEKFPIGFLRDDGTGWRPDVDWIIKPDSVDKVLEGKYDLGRVQNQRPRLMTAEEEATWDPYGDVR